MSAHTPGPWRVIEDRYTQTVDATGELEYTPNKRPVASWAFDGVRSREENRANASLIAAAPELLEALRQIAAYRPLTFAECSDAEAVIGIAEAAIAKAEGK